MTEQNLKQLADLHDENIELKKEIERLKQHYNIDKLDKAAENYANNWFDMHDTNHYKALKQGFEAGSKWQINQISPAIKACELEIERLKAEREWISVGTKMPEIAQKVLVHFDKIDNTLIGYLAYGKNNAETWVVYYKDGECLNDGEFAETITHWMPLPKNP